MGDSLTGARESERRGTKAAWPKGSGNTGTRFNARTPGVPEVAPWSSQVFQQEELCGARAGLALNSPPPPGSPRLSVRADAPKNSRLPPGNPPPGSALALALAFRLFWNLLLGHLFPRPRTHLAQLACHIAANHISLIAPRSAPSTATPGRPGDLERERCCSHPRGGGERVPLGSTPGSYDHLMTDGPGLAKIIQISPITPTGSELNLIDPSAVREF